MKWDWRLPRLFPKGYEGADMMPSPEGGKSMISYAPLWATMKQKGVTTYQLIHRHSFSRGTLDSLKAEHPCASRQQRGGQRNCRNPTSLTRFDCLL